MALAKVYNDNIYPHVEVYKGDTITIAAGGYHVMDHDEATQFLGQFYPMKKNADGLTQDPRSFKKLRLELAGPLDAVAPSLVCHATGRIAKDEAELKAWNAEHADKLDPGSKKHLDDLKEKEGRIAELEAQLAAAQSKKRGRPPKTNEPEANVDGL